jgi:hypothetical protein
MMGKHMKDSQEAKFLLEKYAPVASTEEEQVIESLDLLSAHAKMPGQSTQAFLNDVARVIYKSFGFKEISIGIKEKDGLFRYAAMLGFRDEVKATRHRPSYTLAEMMDKRAYPSTKVNRIVEIHLKEDMPTKEGDENMYNRPSLIGQERTSPDSMMEGDYIEMRIFGLNDELLGWIELSSPRDGKFPSRGTLKWLEFVSMITATILNLKEYARGSVR